MPLTPPAHAGRNADGALIVHTADQYSYSHGTACTTAYAAPSSCETADTRTDRSEGSVVWTLAAFDSAVSPAVTVVYFGIDYDDANLDPGTAYRFCGPAGTLEVPDADWPYSGRGNSVAFGEPVAGQTLFPFYVFRIDGGTEGSYFSTTENPVAGYAAFVDDGDPPEMDEVTRFGTVRWFAGGDNDCPTGADGGGGGDDMPEGDGEWTGDELDDWLDGEAPVQWEPNCILARLREDGPIAPREKAEFIGVSSIDALGRELGALSIRRVVSLPDSLYARMPDLYRIIRIDLPPDADEQLIAQRYEDLPEVVTANPNYVAPAEFFGPPTNDPMVGKQYYLLPEDQLSCLEDPLKPVAPGCDLGIDAAWATGTRGNPDVKIAFVDDGADMQHPDLFPAYAFNVTEDANGDGVAQLCPWPEGDLDGEDSDDIGDVADDVLLGYATVWDFAHGYYKDWQHWPQEGAQDDHGTKVAGLLGAVTGNGKCIASVAGGSHPAPGIQLIQFSIRGEFVPPPWPIDYAIESIAYAAAHGAQIYSTSGGMPVSEEMEFVVESMSDSMLFVASAGNRATSPPYYQFARLKGVMAVGEYDHSGGRWMIPNRGIANYPRPDWRGSDFGEALSVLGPTSADAVSGHPPDYGCKPNDNDTPGCFGGTSAAAPIVASVAALVESYLYDHYQMFTLPDAQVVRMILEHTAEDVLCDSLLFLDGCNCANETPPEDCAIRMLGRDEFSGYGRIDAGRALTLPVAVLDTLETIHFVGDTLTLAWTALDINVENGWLDPNSSAHFELHYLRPDHGVDWQTIDTTIAPTAESYEWVVPETALGDDRRIRLTVIDSGEHTNEDYSVRFSVRSPADARDEGGGATLLVAPNPVGRATRVSLVLVTPSEVQIQVLDVTGRRVKTLVEGRQPAGSKRFDWDRTNDSGREVANGVYFIRARLGSRTRLERLVLVR